MRCLMFYKIVTWRILYLTFLGRECPELTCDVVLRRGMETGVANREERGIARCRTPTLSEFLPLLAQLGGYNSRKSDPPPGPKALWIASRRMMDFAMAWRAFGPTEHI